MIKKFSLSLIVALYIGFATVFIFGVNSSIAFAAEGNACTNPDSGFLGLPTWYKYLEQQEDSTGRCSPVLSYDESNTAQTKEEQKVNSALPIGLAILEGMLRLSGIVAVVMIFWAAFKFITTQGAPDAAAGARKTAINAMIGLVIVIIATTLVSFVGNSLLPS
jgi:hypothetical protein